MDEASILDTNVLLVANGDHPDVSPRCVIACVDKLLAVEAGGKVVIDDGWRILNEYSNKTRPNQPKGVGDTFLKWLLRNVANASRCTQVTITEVAESEFAEFPNHADLAGFDPPDRKFVAVAVVFGAAPISQAADSKWIDWAPALKDSGVSVEFLCPEDLAAFDAKKKA